MLLGAEMPEQKSNYFRMRIAHSVLIPNEHALMGVPKLASPQHTGEASNTVP